MPYARNGSSSPPLEKGDLGVFIKAYKTPPAPLFQRGEFYNKILKTKNCLQKITLYGSQRKAKNPARIILPSMRDSSIRLDSMRFRW
jgi:hypothetical protein